MNKDFLAVAEREMEAISANGPNDDTVLGRLVTAVEAILMHFREQEKADVRFELATQPGDIVPSVQEIAAKLAKDFCQGCGANVPPKDGEGTCPTCDPAVVGRKLVEALNVLTTLDSIMPLGDLVYVIREREGQGWHGPKVTAWGIACARLAKLLKSVPQTASQIVPWPKNWPAYPGCDVLVGPCACGAWHQKGQFEFRQGGIVRNF